MVLDVDKLFHSHKLATVGIGITNGIHSRVRWLKKVIRFATIPSFTTTMMTPVVIVLLSLLVVLAAGQSTPNPPNPGDPIDWSVPFPDWFFDIKGQFEKREVRK